MLIYKINSNNKILFKDKIIEIKMKVRINDIKKILINILFNKKTIFIIL